MHIASRGLLILGQITLCPAAPTRRIGFTFGLIANNGFHFQQT